MKLFLLSILFLSSCSSLKTSNQTKMKIEVTYSESADIFDLMDNVSNWWPGFTEEAYQKEWIRRFGSLSKKDINLFRRYKELRYKHYDDSDSKPRNPLANRNGFFSRLGSATADPVAEAFYSSDSLEESFKKAQKTLEKGELNFLIDFYKYFENKYSKLVSESKQHFSKSIENTSSSIESNEVATYFSDVSKFYNVKKNLKYRILYVWWPPLDRTNASPTGSYLIMRYNPLEHSGGDDSDIVAHEIVHTISLNQPLEQKQNLTKEFFGKCNVNGKIKRSRILEEPLAVVFGQLIFNKKFNSKSFKLADNLYSSKWITTMARLIYPTAYDRFLEGESINDGLIHDAATFCRDLIKANEELDNKRAKQ